MTTLQAAPPRLRVLLLGATGTQGQACARALLARGHEVTALVRPGAAAAQGLPRHLHLQWGEVTEAGSVAAALAHFGPTDAVVSCLASRSGVPADAWAVDHRAHQWALLSAQAAGVERFVQLSAICVQRPRLAFQHAKLAFEASLQASPLDWRIVRPTAFFKSLSGQVQRLRRGAPFLVFGDGRGTACRPLSDEDLADYLADTLVDPLRSRQVLPIGGPGPALTPRDCGRLLAEALGVAPRWRSVPSGLLSAAAAVLDGAARLHAPWAARAELARIGHYYATESMLVWDPAQQCYSDAATPATGRTTLAQHYARLVAGDVQAGLGAHALF